MPEKTSWIGTVWGTNRGTLIAEFTQEGVNVEGDIQLFEPGLGQTGVHLQGAWDNAGKIIGKLDRFTGNYVVPQVLPQSGDLEGQYDSAAEIINGGWKTDLNTNGMFVLAKSKSPQIAAVTQQPPPVVQASPPPRCAFRNRNTTAF
jgi:hypothetical protein